jgi:hypothetical protein
MTVQAWIDVTSSGRENKSFPTLWQDERKAIKASGVKDHFFAYLKEKSTEAQFVIIENDPPPVGVETYATIYSFAGNEGEEGRKGFF